MKIDRQHVLHVFREYADRYDLSDPKIKLKYDHTFRVAALCDDIAGSIGLKGEEKDLAWLSGVFHDIGRFEQVRRFGTFQDGDSVNHAALSAELLFREGMVREYVADSSEDMLLEKAVCLHNAYKLPSSLTGREWRYCTILRDADKVDILRVNCDTPVSEIYNLPEKQFETAAVTDAVYADIMAGQNVYRPHSKTAIDFLIGHMSFVFGLVYPESVRQMKEQGYLERIMHFPTKNPETEQKLAEIRSFIHAYMDRRIAEQSVLPREGTESAGKTAEEIIAEEERKAAER